MTFTKPFWIAGPWRGRLAVSARPRGEDWLDDEIKSWRAAGVDVVVSLLESPEAADLGLERERDICQANGMTFYSFPIIDRDVPVSDDAAVDLFGKLDKELATGRSVLIHCRQGVGRAGLVAAALLVESNLNPKEAVERVSAARGVAVPETEAQRVWIDTFAAALDRRR